jgi:hypothetical protein
MLLKLFKKPNACQYCFSALNLLTYLYKYFFMNKKILLAETLALFIILGFKLSIIKNPDILPPANRSTIYKSRFVVSCSPDWNILNADSLAETMQPLPGWGNYKWPIKTTSDSAQFYFNQGINMYYAFHIIEAMASFKKAELFDNSNPMIFWAQALAYGPNINDFAYAGNPDAVAAAEKAKQLSANAGNKEKGLIDAMLVRYSNDSAISRKALNQLYASAMKKNYGRFKNDGDISALYADALMLQHPWEYWQHDGKPQPWTPEIMLVLENILKLHPNHPGANHYYIHTMEASPTPGKALPSAHRLGSLMPEVSHMVHMPSHIYIRTGNYEKGIIVNERAVNGYNKYLSLYPAVVNNAFLYLIHNYHMKAACAMMKSNYANSIKAANETIASFESSFLSLPHPMGNFVQYVYLSTQMVNVRYGKWNEVLSYPELSPNYAFGYALNKWAKGLAFANTGKLAEAKNELVLLKEKMKHPDMQIILEPFNKPYDQAMVAQKILEGVIAQKENNYSQAILYFKEALIAEDKLIYTEPRDWLIPSRHYLANALILAKEYPAAEKILKEDLLINPNNFYALMGLQQTYALQKNRIADLNKNSHQLKAAFKGADMPQPALVY